MIDQLRREADVGRSAMVAAKRIQAMRGALEQQLMRAPTTAEMAVAFDMSAEDYFALERNATHGRSTSLDELTDIGAFLATDEDAGAHERSEEHTSELQSLMRISYAVFCLKKKNTTQNTHSTTPITTTQSVTKIH